MYFILQYQYLDETLAVHIVRCLDATPSQHNSRTRLSHLGTRRSALWSNMHINIHSKVEIYGPVTIYETLTYQISHSNFHSQFSSQTL